MSHHKAIVIFLKSSAMLLAMLVLSFLMFSPVSARTQVYCPLVFNTNDYKKLVDTWYEKAEIKGFSLSTFNFCGDESRNVSGNILLSSKSLSKLGLNYVLTLGATANKNTNTLELNFGIDNRKIAELVERFESKKEVGDFVKRFHGTLEKDVFLFVFRVNSGSYFLEYDYTKNEFPRYSLPILMSDDFPLLTNFKDKVEAAGCSVNKNEAITHIKNEYWNTMTFYSVVDGDCKRSDTYTPAVFEVEYPIRRDLWTRLKIWFKNLQH